MIRKYFQKFKHWFTTPQTSNLINRENFVNVQLDAVGVGMASAALPFVPVFLARLGANNLQVGLITSLPALAGFLLSIPLGQFLETRENIVPWYSLTRAIALTRFALIGFISMIFPTKDVIFIILLIWAIFTVPQTLLSTLFSLVMNSVAGPKGRFELMSRRWSIIGITTAVTVFLTGQILDRIVFPLNYQIIFVVFSLGGVLSYQFSRRLVIPAYIPIVSKQKLSLGEKIRQYTKMIANEKPFLQFAPKRFLFVLGLSMAAPLLPIYYVNQIHAPDSWIAIFSTTQTAITFIGYFLWLKQSRKRGSRFVLICTTLGMSFFPMVIAILSKFWLIALFAGIQGLFESGLNLVFFDELMKTVPEERSATFLSIAQSIQFLASTIAPIMATGIADQIGLPYTLFISGGIQLLGFFLFLFGKTGQAQPLMENEL